MKGFFQVLFDSTRRFNDDKCWTAAIVVSYFALLCIVPLLVLFFFLSSKLVGGTEVALRSLNLFTDEFFARLNPEFFKNLSGLHKNVASLGWFGLVGSVVAASFLFANLISTINLIFRARVKRSFVYNRIMEYVTMLAVGVLMIFSLSITAAWTAMGRAVMESDVVAGYINPRAVDLINSFGIQYLIPFGLSWLVCYIMYKYIPEVKVRQCAAVVPAFVAALLNEIFKRMFAFYVVHFSAVGVVLNKLSQGTLTSIIFFLLWITFSMVILLWGAELAAVMNERMGPKLQRHVLKEVPPPA